jgi:predicted Fe-Mo cluster-binding NifX family protein
MRRIRVALGSNDGENIVADHMGTARDFYIFDLFEDGSSVLVEKRKNTSPEEDENKSNHGDVRKLRAAMRIFEDCDVVLGRRGSPNFFRMRDNTELQPVVTRVDALSGLILELAKSFEEMYGLVERRKRGERPRTIPIIGRTSEIKDKERL